MLNPFQNKNKINEILKRNVNIFSLELLPRITRAQSMDVLSSQSNLAGYRAVIDCVAEFEKAVPMMMTAAGTNWKTCGRRFWTWRKGSPSFPPCCSPA